MDFEYYLAQQILLPIECLCDRIEGTDTARLVERLGLEPGRFRSSVSNNQEGRAFSRLESQIPDSERFKDCDELVIRCRKCSSEMPFTHISKRDVSNSILCFRVACMSNVDGDVQTSILHGSGPKCPGCEAPLTPASLQVQLENHIRERVNRYYEGWTVCDEPECRNRTRMMCVYGRRCLKPGCKGTVTFEVRFLSLELDVC